MPSLTRNTISPTQIYIWSNSAITGLCKQKAGKPAFPCSQISLKLHNLPRIKDQLGVKSQLDRLVKFDHAGTDEFLRVFETAVADAVLAGELSARSR